ncbi:MAG: Golgi phosphoprotein 3 [Planctomycetota bacterium]|jgi:Golgi phosphoprotein 3
MSIEEETTLSLPEEALLLALRDKAGTLHSSQGSQCALAGAFFAELALRGQIKIEGECIKLLGRSDASKTQVDLLLNEIYSEIEASPNTFPSKFWIALVASRGELLTRVAGSLTERGILEAEVDTFAWIFRRRRWPELDPLPERELLERLRKVIFDQVDTVAPRTAALLALAYRSRVLEPVFGQELESRREHIEQVIAGNHALDTTQAALDQQAAAFWFLGVM